MINFETAKHHWNYFLAIEKDLENISRFIEFAGPNLGTYSIELTHILLSSASEIDVIMKQLCTMLKPEGQNRNINDYRQIIQTRLPEFINEEIFIERYGLSYKPWENWQEDQNPHWWTSHNNVKHQRNEHYHEANLQNTINAVGALLLTTIYYYKFAFSEEVNQNVNLKETTNQLKPESSLMTMNGDYYYRNIVV